MVCLSDKSENADIALGEKVNDDNRIPDQDLYRRMKPFKIGTLVRISTLRILLEMNSAYLWKNIYHHLVE